MMASNHEPNGLNGFPHGRRMSDRPLFTRRGALTGHESKDSHPGVTNFENAPLLSDEARAYEKNLTVCEMDTKSNF